MSIVRAIVSSNRTRTNDESTSTSLDLAYITSNIIVMSTPAATFPRTLYRNPVDQVRKFLDHYHRDHYCIFNFRGEGRDYADEAFHGRVHTIGWPDHHPPPFSIMPKLLYIIYTYLQSSPKATAVLHCKAGKGRSGTVTTSYLITYCGMDVTDALNLFSEKRMRVGRGVSIPSQRRWVNYVALWNARGRLFNEIKIEVLKIEVWGLRDGTLEVGVASFVDNESNSMKKVESSHIFTPEETTKTGKVTVFTPDEDVTVLSDVNIFLARHQKGLPKIMPLSLAHCWFNAYFERILEEEAGAHGEKHYFHVDWDHMDGIGGTNKKLAQAFDRMRVTWKESDPTAEHHHHARRSSTMESLSTAGRLIAGDTRLNAELRH